jgi:hypothetical protein
MMKRPTPDGIARYWLMLKGRLNRLGAFLERTKGESP